MTTDGADAHKAVEEAARAARGTVADLAGVPGERLDQALRAIADGLVRGSAPVLAANEADMAAAREAGLGGGLLDRLRLDEARLEAIADQLRALAGVPYEAAERVVRELPGGLLLTERRRPVGVIGANFEARPNVVVDIASQFVKSRNAGVLRTGSAAIRSAVTLADEVIAPALAAAGPRPGHDPAGPGARAGIGPGAGQPARPDPAGDPARQRGQHPLAGRRGGAARGAHDGARRRRRGPVRRRRRRPGPGRAADRGQPGPARRVQPAQPAAGPPVAVGRLPAPGHRAAGPAGHRRLAAAARAPARPRVGAGLRQRGDRHRGPGRRPARRGRAGQRGDLRAGRGDRDARPGRGG